MPELDGAKLVFLDETWATTNMTRTRGRALRGQRLIGVVPHGHWQTTTFLCGLRHDGLVAPLVLDGAIDGPSFLAWVEQFLAPTLAPGDIDQLFVSGVQCAHRRHKSDIRRGVEGASQFFNGVNRPHVHPLYICGFLHRPEIRYSYRFHGHYHALRKK